jgi:hypothetical protein
LEDYRGFEAAIISDYDPITTVERELVLRLASLLWRLRHASAIETDLFRIQAEILRDRHSRETIERLPCDPGRDAARWPEQPDDSGFNHCRPGIVNPIRDITHAFQRQNNLDNGAFDRLGRYEAALWRQMIKTLLILRHRARR